MQVGWWSIRDYNWTLLHHQTFHSIKITVVENWNPPRRSSARMLMLRTMLYMISWIYSHVTKSTFRYQQKQETFHFNFWIFFLFVCFFHWQEIPCWNSGMTCLTSHFITFMGEGLDWMVRSQQSLLKFLHTGYMYIGLCGCFPFHQVIEMAIR